MNFSATYSPDDNKLRLYASARLDRETYDRVRAAGFIWAPKQDLFVAPKWTPEREDLLLELAGEIDDEDTSLTDRAEERAERFDEYSEKRGADSTRAHAAVAAIADNIPLGQPILVGHHSERRARRDAERIRSGMDKAVKLWQTSKYWTARAAGAIRHAKYKERGDVRARRIGTIEAEQRKCQRAGVDAERLASAWEKLTDPMSVLREGEPITFAERVKYVAGRGVGCRYELARELEDGKVTPEQAQADVVAALRARKAHLDRQVEHCENRLAYERAMLAASGWTPPAKPKTKADLPILNYGGRVAYRNPYRNEIVETEAVGITKAELAKIHKDYKGTRLSACGTHRLRSAVIRGGLVVVYLTDSKQHERPSAAEVSKQAEAEEDATEEMMRAEVAKAAARAEASAAAAPARAEKAVADAPFEAMRESLRAGVAVVVAPQLFPTPAALAAQMARDLDVKPGQRVLEPSAGTGVLLRAIDEARGYLDEREPACDVVAVEINRDLADAIDRGALAGTVARGDFLQMVAADLGGRFDRIAMNPPFENGADIAHVLHAFAMLNPGGRLISVVAAGPRQRAQLAPLGVWSDLPPGTFASQGTRVQTALIRLEKAA